MWLVYITGPSLQVKKVPQVFLQRLEYGRIRSLQPWRADRYVCLQFLRMAIGPISQNH